MLVCFFSLFSSPFFIFIYLFLGGVSVCLVKEMFCSYSTCLIGLCSTEKMKAGLHAAFFVLFPMCRILHLSAI